MIRQWWLDDDAGGWFEKEGVTARKFWRSACLFGYNCFTDLGQGSYIEAPTNAAWWNRVSLISQNVPEWLHNDFLGAILCQSHPKKNSDFYLHFWPLAPHIAEAVGANGKTASKWLKKYQISKLAENIFNSWKRLKPNAIPSFLGDVGLIKVVSKFLFGHPKCHFWACKEGHFRQQCPSLRAQKWHFGCPN